MKIGIPTKRSPHTCFFVILQLSQLSGDNCNSLILHVSDPAKSRPKTLETSKTSETPLHHGHLILLTYEN